MNTFSKTRQHSAIIAVTVRILFLASLCWSQTDGYTGDFEEGNLRGWEATGTAFSHQPTLDDNPTARGRQQPSNHQGRYWIGTYENYQGQQRQKPGNVQGDEPVGTLTSMAFTIPRGVLEFLVGGGNDFNTRVELLIQDPLEGTSRSNYASGLNSETMRRVTWDLTPYAGKTGRIRIVDNASGPWGHINADDFRIIPEEPPPTSAMVRVPDLYGLTIEQAAETLESSRLRPGRLGRRPSDRQPDTVIGQDPPPETEARPGSRVTLIVAEAERPPAGNYRNNGTPPPPGMPKWLWLIPGLLAVWAGFRLANRKKKQGKTPPTATIRMRTLRDSGTQTLLSDTPRLTGPEIRLRPVSDRGRQDVTVMESRPD